MSSSTKAWSSLDRKATAVAEFTLRQYRTRLSTWVVLASCMVALSTVLLFYIDFMNDPIESVDNDGDGLFDEDGPDFPSSTDATVVSMGYDDDGDCLEADRPDGAKDTNGNGVVCDGFIRQSWYGSELTRDNGVDEDPDDEAIIQEATHRAFLLGYGKLGVVFLLGIFLPLFLATGLIRGEMTSETMHFLLAKPIARGEVLLYRLLGYLALVWPASAVIVGLSALVTGLAAPGDGLYRFEDLGICLANTASCMVWPSNHHAHTIPSSDMPPMPPVLVTTSSGFTEPRQKATSTALLFVARPTSRRSRFRPLPCHGIGVCCTFPTVRTSIGSCPTLPQPSARSTTGRGSRGTSGTWL